MDTNFILSLMEAHPEFTYRIVDDERGELGVSLPAKGWDALKILGNHKSLWFSDRDPNCRDVVSFIDGGAIMSVLDVSDGLNTRSAHPVLKEMSNDLEFASYAGVPPPLSEWPGNIARWFCEKFHPVLYQLTDRKQEFWHIVNPPRQKLSVEDFDEGLTSRIRRSLL